MAGSWIEIDRAPLIANTAIFRERLPRECELMAVVKGNAYGHGALATIPILDPRVDWLGVDSVQEALELGVAQAKSPVLILGHTPAEHVDNVVRHRHRQVVFRRDTVAALAGAAEALDQTAVVHVKVETGLHRLGVALDELPSFARFLADFERIEVEGVYTHFADVEDPASSFYQEQLARLRRAVDVLHASGLGPKYVHASPTAGVLLHDQDTLTIARVGLGLYGVWPSSETRDAIPDVALQPVLSWKCRIAQIQTVAAGESVGYDRTFRASSPRRIAVIPVGYYDGFDRKLSGRGMVLVGGRRAPVVGRVAMNMTMIDVTDTSARQDDEVVLIGEQGNASITADDVAGWCDTIAYEVLARLNREIPRTVR